jgi:hypothetical protein
VSFKKRENVLEVCREGKEKLTYNWNKLKKKQTATKVSIWQLKQQKIKAKLPWLNVNVQENRLVLRLEDFNKKFKTLLSNYQTNRNVYNSRKIHINNNFANSTKSTLKVKTKGKSSHLTTTLFWPSWKKQKSAIKQTQKRKIVPILNKRINWINGLINWLKHCKNQRKNTAKKKLSLQRLVHSWRQLRKEKARERSVWEQLKVNFNWPKCCWRKN